MLVVLLLASSGCSEDAGHALATADLSHSPLLALIEQPKDGVRLDWLDPAMLRPLERSSVRLAGGVWSPVVAPEGERIALGGRGNEGIRIIDVAQMRFVGRVARATADRSIVPLARPVEHRLLALEFKWMQGPAVPYVQDLVVINPVASRVVAPVITLPVDS